MLDIPALLRLAPSVSKEKVKLIALPLKIKGGDGAPARVIAMEK